MNKRELNLGKYGISNKRYKELCGFCEQYPEWKKSAQKYENTLAGVQMTDMPGSPNRGTSDMTGNAATTIIDNQRKCEMIEKVAKEASPDFWECIIKSVCYEVSVTYLIVYERMALSKSAFYEKRRYFFYLLDREKD